MADGGGGRRPNQAALGPIAKAVLVLVVAAASAGMLLAMAPGLTAVTAPILCPADTERTVVVLEGTRRIHWYLYCLNRDGVGLEPSSFLVWLTMAGELAALLGIVTIVSSVMSRRSSVTHTETP